MNDEWRRQLKAMNKGPVDLRTGRHAPFSRTISLPGDLTGATLAGQVRLYPDQGGAALVAFTVGALAVVSGRTNFTISLTEAQIEALPAATPGEGAVTLIYDLLLTPSGGIKEPLWGGHFIVVGGATNV